MTQAHILYIRQAEDSRYSKRIKVLVSKICVMMVTYFQPAHQDLLIHFELYQLLQTTGFKYQLTLVTKQQKYYVHFQANNQAVFTSPVIPSKCIIFQKVIFTNYFREKLLYKDTEVHKKTSQYNQTEVCLQFFVSKTFLPHIEQMPFLQAHP